MVQDEFKRIVQHLTKDDATYRGQFPARFTVPELIAQVLSLGYAEEEAVERAFKTEVDASA